MSELKAPRMLLPVRGARLDGGSKTPNSVRRYVIDEVIGSADMLHEFSVAGRIPDSHDVGIEGGKGRYVHILRCRLRRSELVERVDGLEKNRKTTDRAVPRFIKN